SLCSTAPSLSWTFSPSARKARTASYRSNLLSSNIPCRVSVKRTTVSVASLAASVDAVQAKPSSKLVDVEPTSASLASNASSKSKPSNAPNVAGDVNQTTSPSSLSLATQTLAKALCSTL